MDFEILDRSENCLCAVEEIEGKTVSIHKGPQREVAEPCVGNLQIAEMNVFCNLDIAKMIISQKVLSLFRRFFTLWVDMYPYKVGGMVRKRGKKGEGY